MEIHVRLEFNHIFPDEQPHEILFYLSKVQRNLLLGVIGYSNFIHKSNPSDLISNPKLIKEIAEKENAVNVKFRTKFITRKTSLKIAEVILQNIKTFNNLESNTDQNEINLIKAFLIVNQQLNKAEDDFEIAIPSDNNKMADFLIITSFSDSDIGLSNRNDKNFIVNLYSSLLRFEYLLDFLSKDIYKYLLDDLLNYFKQKNKKDLFDQVLLLFGRLVIMMKNNELYFEIENKKQSLFMALCQI